MKKDIRNTMIEKRLSLSKEEKKIADLKIISIIQNDQRYQNLTGYEFQMIKQTVHLIPSRKHQHNLLYKHHLLLPHHCHRQIVLPYPDMQQYIPHYPNIR